MNAAAVKATIVQWAKERKEYVFQVSLRLGSAGQPALSEWTIMQRRLRSLADAREELVQIQDEFTRLQKRIETVRDCVTDSLARFFGEQRPAFTGLHEEELIEKIADRVVARIGTLQPKPKTEAEPKYLREHAAAKRLGVSASTLRSWRGKRRTVALPVTRVGKIVLYSVRELERFMEERTVVRR